MTEAKTENKAYGIDYIYEKHGRLSIQFELLTDELLRTRATLQNQTKALEEAKETALGFQRELDDLRREQSQNEDALRELRRALCSRELTIEQLEAALAQQQEKAGDA